MSNVDNKLQELGFVLTDHDDMAGYWVYENEESDQRVDISFNSEHWLVASGTISTHDDWYGNPQNEPMGLTYEELKVFMEKIEELKQVFGDAYAYTITRLPN